MSEWISVRDQPVPRNTPIIVTTGHIRAFCELGDGEPYAVMRGITGFCACDWQHDIRVQDITHWMPVPEPPQLDASVHPDSQVSAWDVVTNADFRVDCLLGFFRNQDPGVPNALEERFGMLTGVKDPTLGEARYEEFYGRRWKHFRAATVEELLRRTFTGNRERGSVLYDLASGSELVERVLILPPESLRRLYATMGMKIDEDKTAGRQSALLVVRAGHAGTFADLVREVEKEEAVMRAREQP